jgi:ankyrin repeat protein
MALIERLRRAVDAQNYQRLVTNLVECDDTNCNINVLTSAGDGLIHRAVKIHNRTIMKLLLKYGADINLPDSNGHTPFDVAVLSESIEWIRYLLDEGAQIPHDIIKRAIEWNLNQEVIEYLLEQGASVGSAKQFVQKILSHHEDYAEYYEDDEADERYQDLYNLLDEYDVKVKEPED